MLPGVCVTNQDDNRLWVAIEDGNEYKIALLMHMVQSLGWGKHHFYFIKQITVFLDDIIKFLISYKF